MKKYGSKFFLAFAILILIALTACATPSESAAPVQFEDPILPLEFPTVAEFQQYVQPEIDLLANSTESGSSGKCASSRNGNEIWVSLSEEKSFLIEFVKTVEKINIPEIASGESVYRKFSINEDFVLIDISTSNTSKSKQPFIKLVCFEARVFTHVQYDIFVPYGLYYFRSQEGEKDFKDSYILLYPDKISFISIDTIKDLKLDPIDRRSGTATPQP